MSTYEEATARWLRTGGQGSVQTIVRSWDQKLMARKIIRLDTADEKMMRNAKTEYRTHRYLNHPNIAKYVDAEWLDGEVRFYMEYFEDGSLDTLKIAPKDDFIPTDAQRDDVQSNVWAIIFQLSGAVAYCHNREKKVSSIDYGEDDEHIMGSSEVYHRDIKPQNVLRASDAESSLATLKLSDFGLAIILEGSKKPTTDNIGTSQYMPPEITKGKDGGAKWTTKCDVYSLGCTLYEVCNGRPPFKSPPESQDEVERLTTTREFYTDRQLGALLSKCLRYDPSQRPEAAELYTMAKEKLQGTTYESALQLDGLLRAVEEGCLEKVRSRLDKYQNPEKLGISGYTPLHKAVQLRKVEIVKELLTKGFDPLAETEDHKTPIHMALESTIELKQRKIQLYRKSLTPKDRASPSTDVTSQQNELHLEIRKIEEALKSEDDVMAEDLVSGCKIETWDRFYSRGWTLLHLAAAADNVHIVKHVLRGNSHWNLLTKSKDWSLIHIAARNGHSELLGFLLKRKETIRERRVEAKSSEGATPLFEASRRGQIKALNLLLEANADINVTNNEGFTALHVAALEGHSGLVNTLLQNNKIRKVGETTKRGETALHLAVQESRESCVEVIHYLASRIEVDARATATINKTLQKKCTALHIAVEKGNSHGTEKLLALQANPNTTTEKLDTALHLAARNGFKDIVDKLLAKGGISSKRNRNKDMPLHVAIENSTKNERGEITVNKAVTETAKRLVEHDRTAVAWGNRGGDIAIHLAARKGNFPFLKFAHERNKALVNNQNHLGETALHLAAQMDHRRIVEYLLVDAQADHSVKNQGQKIPLDIAKPNSKRYLEGYGK